MMFSCSVWSPKGGCGKSTIALTLASFFAAEDTSRKVLLVDADAQQSARTWEAQARQLGHALPFEVAASNARASSYDVVVYDHAPGLAGSTLKGQVVLLPVLPSFFDAASAIRGEADLRSKGQRVMMLPNRVETSHASDVAFLAGFVGKPYIKKRKAAYQATVARGLTLYGADKSGIRGLKEARAEFERVVDGLIDLAAA